MMNPEHQHSEIPLVSWSWREGRIWDNWMIVHFLSGTTIASALGLMSFSQGYAYLIAFGLLVAWELGEKVGRIEEESENLVLDVVFGMLGFALFEHYLVAHMTQSQTWWSFGVTFALTLGGSLLGWMAYRRRTL